MITSKKDKAQADIDRALQELQQFVATQPRSSEARAEARMLRDMVAETNVCPYCGEPIVDRSPRQVDACKPCGARIARMMMTKSKLMRGVYSVSSLEKYKEDYGALLFVPYALGGVNGSALEQVHNILVSVDNLLIALSNMKKLTSEENRELLKQRLINNRLTDIRSDLVRLGADASEDGFEERVKEIYNSRYKDFEV